MIVCKVIRLVLRCRESLPADHGADVNAANSSGNTALVWAAESGWRDGVRVLELLDAAYRSAEDGTRETLD